MSNVILIGFMGCGKTSVGLRLSYRLRRIVEDTDRLIEKKEGRSISSIFSCEGEEYFRRQETACLRELIQSKEEKILATGGGLPMREENRLLLKQLGCVVYLRISPQEVYERLKNDTSRPLLQCDDPLTRIRELMESRAAVYEQTADIVVDVDGRSMEQVLCGVTDGLIEKGCISQEDIYENTGH